MAYAFMPCFDVDAATLMPPLIIDIADAIFRYATYLMF